MVEDEAAPPTPSLRERHTGGSRTVLELAYDGAAPPLELFEALRAAGWTDLVPPPPPAAAFDWGRPDPAAGTPYTIRPHRAVVAATIEGPPEARRAASAAARATIDRISGGPGAGAGSGDAVVEVVCAAAGAETVRRAVIGIGVVVDDRPETREVVLTFRGSAVTSAEPVHRMRLVIAGSGHDELVHRLSGAGVRSLSRIG